MLFIIIIKLIKLIFLRQSDAEVAELLTRMCLKSESTGKGKMNVEVPPTRHDVLHSCDIYEDLAIAYGYNNIRKVVPRTSTIAKQVIIILQ